MHYDLIILITDQGPPMSYKVKEPPIIDNSLYKFTTIDDDTVIIPSHLNFVMESNSEDID